MRERARHLLYVENLVRGVFNAPCGDDEVHGGNYYRALRNEKSAAPLAIVDPHVAASGVFGQSHVGDEVLRHVNAFKQFQFRHDVSPTIALGYQITTLRNSARLFSLVPMFRFCAASCLGVRQFRTRNKAAASGRGIPLTALVHAVSGEINRNLKSLSIQTAKKYAVITIDALRSFCGFDPRSRNLNPLSLRSAAPTAFAVVSVAHSKPSNRLRVCV